MRGHLFDYPDEGTQTMKFNALKGFKDVLPDDSFRWQYVEQTMRDLCAVYGIREIRTPVLEHTELVFTRSRGYDRYRAKGDVYF